jgi:hypothetical protein
MICMQHSPHGENELYISSLTALLKGKIIVSHFLCRVGPICFITTILNIVIYLMQKEELNNMRTM